MPSDAEVTQRAGRLRAMTGFTQPEFTALLPHFEHALLASMPEQTLAGHPRTSRRSSPYDTSPIPTMAETLLLILTYLKQHPIQEVPGQLLGMSQANAQEWLHLLHMVLKQALAQQEQLPARTAAE
jgi:Helix-turn-helix of DDE superfamily endonuclease